MAPLPANNTAVLFVDYTVQLHQHTLQCRYDIPNTPEDAMTSVAELLAALSSFMSTTTIDGARFRNKDSDVSTDIAWTGATGYGEGTGSEFVTAYYVDFVGRSAGGRRVRVAVFGVENFIAGGNYRASLGESGPVDAGQAVLAAAEGTFLAIDGQQPIWKTYGNLGINAYWRNQIR